VGRVGVVGLIVHRVRVEPAGLDLVVAEGQTLMEAAHAAGYYWPTVCGGKGSCRTCFAAVLTGAEHLSPVQPWEAEGIDALALGPAEAPSVRLACQARVRGPVTVRKLGVRLID
jgi:ferredoxin